MVAAVKAAATNFKRSVKKSIFINILIVAQKEQS